MEKELYLNVNCYLKMKDGETTKEAAQRFYDYLKSKTEKDDIVSFEIVESFINE